MSKIYHFTSIDSFEKIMSSKVLFFSNISSCSNDPSEGNYQQKYIASYIKDNYPNYNPALFNINTTKNENLSLFTISLSLDLYNIHNWMEYANYGNGIAIEFDKEKLEQFISNFNGYMKVDKVLYYDPKIKNVIDEIFINNSNIANKLMMLYPFIKHKAYKCEQEYRIAFVDYEYDHINDKVSDKYDIPDFGYCDEYHHFILNLEYLISKHIISNIIFGPNVTIYNENRIKEICGNKFCFSKCLIPIKKIK